MRLQLYLRFFTQYGQSLYITGNCEALGSRNETLALPMNYLSDEFWTATIELGKDFENELQYQYILKNADGTTTTEWGNDRVIEVMKVTAEDITVVDTWNHAGEFENAFYTQPFTDVLLPKHKAPKSKSYKNITHILKAKAPLLGKDEVLCIAGSNDAFGSWDETKPQLMQREGNWWVARLNLSKENFPSAYKYGVFNTKTKTFVQYESGNNRMLYDAAGAKKITILHDGFAQLPNTTWHGAGISVPVFSLRSNKSFGVGEFTDMKLLVDWAVKLKMKLIQILPINDTT
ncbi:MAG TPA: 4-alpha-glucanotransferase, partial [Lacibacter sp.]|nr:4-alpha-glucanotransferase [Lacibacter sp.]